MKGINWEVGSTWYADSFADGRLSISKGDIEKSRDLRLLSTCRSAITQIIENVKGNGRVFVPSFTCHSVIYPFLNAGYDVIGYPLKENLQIDVDGLSEMVDSSRPDVILVHGYFGFNTLGEASDYFKWCRSQKIIVIEDLTQTMFSHFGHLMSDYTVGSIRKWFPIPDGAFISGLEMPELSEDTYLANAKMCALRAKYQYIVNGKGDKNDFMPKFIEAEHILDLQTKPHSISEASLSVLGNTDLSACAFKRRSNYNYLAMRLLSHQEITVIFPKASDLDVPFMLPVYISDRRSEFQSYMARHNVYPTIIWKCPDTLEGKLNETARNIYNRILCFHIDQRYDLRDMCKVANIVDLFFRYR